MVILATEYRRRRRKFCTEGHSVAG